MRTEGTDIAEGPSLDSLKSLDPVRTGASALPPDPQGPERLRHEQTCAHAWLFGVEDVEYRHARFEARTGWHFLARIHTIAAFRARNGGDLCQAEVEVCGSDGIDDLPSGQGDVFSASNSSSEAIAIQDPFWRGRDGTLLPDPATT